MLTKIIKKRHKFKTMVNALEVILAGFVIIGVVVFFFESSVAMSALNWLEIETFYEFINRVLILVVGLELAKLLVTHDIYAISDLLTFVVARKVLKPDLSSVDVFLAIFSFAILFVLNSKFKSKN